MCRIFHREHGDDVSVTSFKFIGNGAYGLCGLSDGRCQLVSTDTAETVHEWQLSEQPLIDIECTTVEGVISDDRRNLSEPEF